ncbi:glycoside hydrolase family 2 protein [Mucilaginibacter celer]|uniref:Glycoside hydrolase family 2 n=1 Tax=Mucilaginibacter celer TaxID=2305508 RepID=A0A494VGY3_9SPHI|nr:glycoside hydrolase family 2 TIM barrel-domain containing protein [Mucilaginibacter celer]AYL93856.1 glycoside hydrolase family 2 [Mucilaginibacter celer]
MKKKLLLLILFTTTALQTFSQRLQYTGVFAPSTGFVKESEKPYRQELSLNGSWQFQPVQLPAGFREGNDSAPALSGMQPDQWDKTLIRIPSPWNVNSFADEHGQGGDFRTYPSYPKEWEHIKMGWLRRKFNVPANYNGKRLLLHFEALAGDSRIMINGKPAGDHFGIFLPFDLDVTSLVKPGAENEVAVGVRKASLFDKNGNYGRRTYQAGSFWGQHIAGIWQDVALIAVPLVYVKDVFVKPDVQGDHLAAEITIKNDGDREANLTVDAGAYKWQAENAADAAEPVGKLASVSALDIPAVKIKVPAHTEKVVTLNTQVGDKLARWSPESPNLYALLARVSNGKQQVDTRYTRFGWRTVSINGGQVLMNGKPVVMRGDSWHFLGTPQMTRRYAVAWFKAMRDAGLNTVRLHAQPYPSFYMDVADEMGIMVLDETAIWASDGGPKVDDPDYWKDTKHHVAELVLRDRNHPSVFGWSVSNEVMPVVVNVMRNPTGIKDTLINYYGIWADICRKLDPTRAWISADGEDDAEGKLPTYVMHYGDQSTMDRAHKSGKPWGVGEAGNAYYGTPEQVAETNGNRAYESFLGRMEGVAQSSYQNLMQQRERESIYNSVFNLVWYGLKPLPIGLKDKTKAPTLEDGVYFTNYKEDSPGVQPERLGPYSTTLNPGYDPALPLYQTWPFFDAIKAAAENKPYEVGKPLANHDAKSAVSGKSSGAAVIGGAGSTLAADLKKLGAIEQTGKAAPHVLFVDGSNPPSAQNKSTIDKVLASGGTVLVWGVGSTGTEALNKLLPATIEVTNRKSSSLLPVVNDRITNGLGAADMYFSELNPADIISNGLDGELVKQSKVLLTANNTDWQKWNKQAEYAKTAMVVRSELEAKPSGTAMIVYEKAAGKMIVTTLPANPKLLKGIRLVRQLLSNAGIALAEGADGSVLNTEGNITGALYAGNFIARSAEDAKTRNFVDPGAADEIKDGLEIHRKIWTSLHADKEIFDLSALDGGTVNGRQQVAYLSFWVSSQRSLEDLLAEPNLPVVNLQVKTGGSAAVFLNGKQILDAETGNEAKELKLKRGWNHFLIKLVCNGSNWQFAAKLTSNQPEFIKTLGSAVQKP